MEISQSLLSEVDRAALTSTGKAETWQHLVAPFRTADTWRSVVEYLGNFIGAWMSEVAAFYCLHHVRWLTPLFVLLLAGFLIRIFITFHDCGHGSYFNSQRWNDRAGILAGFFMLTPYYAWRKAHAIHHATAGDLDRRGTGDIYTMTVDEYLDLSPARRRMYRISRHPLVVFFGGAIVLFLFLQRFTNTWSLRKEDVLRGKEIRNVHWTTLVGGLIVALPGLIGGWKLLLLVHFPAFVIAGGTGVVLFYVQHQFDGAYWRRHKDWSYLAGSLEGSSWMQLPKILQFFTGNIGVHHVHHLAPKIPNYKLQRCVQSSPMFRDGVHVMRIRDAYRSLWLSIYDEESRRLIGWREMDALLAQRAAKARSQRASADPSQSS